jgi:hypothetical protein
MSQMPPMTPNYSGPVPGAAKPAGLAIASMVLGIVSLVLFCVWYISIPCAIVAVVLGFVARGKFKRGEGGGGGMAMAGLICGIIGLSLAVLLIAGVLALFGYGGNKLQQEIERQRKLQQQQQQGGQSGSLMPMLAQHAEAMWNILTTLVLR